MSCTPEMASDLGAFTAQVASSPAIPPAKEVRQMNHKVTHLRPRRPNRRQRVAAAVTVLASQADLRTRAARFAAALEQESAVRGLPPRAAAR